ncbi:MAG: germination protein YpeB [Firmicutes bacterium]|nr:germination protein YpeB [Bacillota bacterium]
MNKNRIITFLAILTVIGFGWGFYESRETNQASVRIENDAARAYYELTDAADQLSVLTSKALVVADSDNRAELYSEISRTAYVAQENLSMLPVYDPTLSRTEQFLNQLGDFSASLIGKAARGEGLTAKETETLKMLNKEITKTASALHELEREEENPFSYKAILAASKKARSGAADGNGIAVTSLSNINTTISKTPALIYDGPYSDHLENKDPVVLKGEEITWDDAISKAKALLGDSFTYEKYGKSSEEAGFAVYTVAIKRGKNDDAPFAYLDISRNGGYPVQFTAQTENGKKGIEKETALKNAADFLKSAGYTDMEAGYHITKNNILTANFTYMLDGAAVYPDMIKVSVDLSNGDIVGMDAKNYLEFHKERTVPSLILTEEAARSHLPAGAKLHGIKKAIIPHNNDTETYCYEFRFTQNDTEYLLYINAETGKEEDVFIVKDDESGTFTQ